MLKNFHKNMSSDEFDDFSEEKLEDSTRKKIVNDILNLNKLQNIEQTSRSEPALRISEFDLVKSSTGNKGSVHVNELAKVLKKRQFQDTVRKVKTSTKARVLPTPLLKPQQERIQRTVAYEKTRLNFDRWEATVTANRASNDLHFPLGDNKRIKEGKVKPLDSSHFRIRSQLEDENVEVFHVEQPAVEEFVLSAKEMKERQKETAKLRAHQSYKEAKARRQNKIKSKKYHRIMRKQKIKEQLKEFEELQKINPEEALKKLEDIEKARAEERFSLRHKGTGQWAKNKQIRAKYDKESRKVLAEQLSISRDLTEKAKRNDSDEEIEEEPSRINVQSQKDNPWINGMEPDQEITDFVGSYRKYWNEKNKIEEEDKSEEIIEKQEESRKVFPPKKDKKLQKVTSKSSGEWEVEDLFDEAEQNLKKTIKNKLQNLKKKNTAKVKETKVSKKKGKSKIDLTMPQQKKKITIDEPLEENSKKNLSTETASLKNLKSLINQNNNQDIDPQNFIKPPSAPKEPTQLKHALPDLITEDSDDETQQKMIMEAFEDDDIITEFNKEKQDTIKNQTEKDINLTLPGWGSWGGTNIKPSSRKRKRIVLKLPKKVPRRDDNKGTLIINEKACSKIREHMVSEVPFPFKTVKDFEASLRQPLGSEFVPETVFRRLTKPGLTTKIGAIIEPMTRSVLVKH